MKNLILKYGLISGAIISAVICTHICTADMDFSNGQLIGYGTMIIAFSSIFFAIKSYRDNELEGRISFVNALKLGLGITLVATIVYIITWFIISNTVAKDFMDQYITYTITQLEASGISENEIAAKTEELESFKEMYKNPLVKIGMTFMEIFPVGLLISLISAFVLKKKS